MKLLDLFCGAGGAAVGYHRAGFTDITGVDINPQPRYPFHFVQGDALEFLAQVWPGDYDLIHASPPCQHYTVLRNCNGPRDYPDLLAATRRVLVATDAPYIIENVVGAPLLHYVQLCGAMFGLRSYRHRRFEASCLLFQPSHPRHLVRANRRKQRRKAHWDAGGFAVIAGDCGTFAGPEAMGIDWMTSKELSQAIPPAFTEFLGRQLIAQLAPQGVRPEGQFLPGVNVLGFLGDEIRKALL